MSQVIDGKEYDKSYSQGMFVEVVGGATLEADFGNGFSVIDLTLSESYPQAILDWPIKTKYKFTLNGGSAVAKPQ